MNKIAIYLKVAVSSCRRSLRPWFSLIGSTTVLAVVISLNIGLIAAGVEGTPETQQAYAAVGGVALSFCIVVGLTSLSLVSGICVRLKSAEASQWKLAGVVPRAVNLILFLESSIVSAASGIAGASMAAALWPPYASFVQISGLPESDTLNQSIPLAALVSGPFITVIVCVTSSIVTSTRVSRMNPLYGLSAIAKFGGRRRSFGRAALNSFAGICALGGIAAIYYAIGRVHELEDTKTGDFLTSYAGMGILLCVALSLFGSGSVTLLAAATRPLKRLGTSWLLAVGEVCVRPRLTRAIVMPVALSAAAVGVIVDWIGKLEALAIHRTGSAASVSAPPGQIALLLGGPIIIACISAASIFFASAAERQQDAALLLVSGASKSIVLKKLIAEGTVLLSISLATAYSVVVTNDLAMTWVLSSGPIPEIHASPLPWQSAAVVAAGISIALIVAFSVTVSGIRKSLVSAAKEGSL